MTTRPIIKYPHPVLRQPCAAIDDINDEIRTLAKDMYNTMLDAKGIGLAAPQVGVAQQLLVIDVTEDRNNTLILANPQIIDKAGDIALEEGCLSVPGVTALVPRAHSVVVRGLGLDGNEKTIEAEELLAVCLQHEIDHLNGVLFFDHISQLKRNRLLSKYKKIGSE